MKFAIKSTSKLKLNLFENKLVYLHNDKLEANEKLPLKVVLTANDTVMYCYENERFLDYSPETLGYYWINKNKCLRTNKGLVFKTTTKKEAVQTRINKEKTITYQNIDWEKSVKPTDEKEYTIKEVTSLKTTLNKSGNNEWYIEVEGKKTIILNNDLEFSYEYEEETGFELIDNTISYYSRQLSNVDIDSFKVLNCNYAIDKNNVFNGNDMLPNVNVATFKVLNYNLAKDKNQVYHFSSILADANPESLQLFANPHSLFFKDKNHIFQGDTIIIGADIDTFKPIGEMFAIDKNHVYRFSKRLKNIDANTFEIISDSYFKDKDHIYLNTHITIIIAKSDVSFQDLGDGYYSLKDSIYHQDYGGANKKISNDITNFKTLSFQWAKDSTTLFYTGKEIYKGDTSTVKILDDYFHIIVHKKVFFYGEEYLMAKEIINIDITTFTTFSLGLAKDKNHLYFMGERIKNALPNSFEQIDKCHFKDKNNFYTINERFSQLTHIKNIDTSTLKILKRGYIKTKEVVYCDEGKITGADPNTFRILEIKGYYSCDKNSVYYLGKKLKKLNIEKLKILNHQFICDDKIVFYENIKLDLNAKDCILLTENFIKDKNKVYYEKTLIKNADAESFEVINNWFQKDKNRLFHLTVPLKLNPNTVKIEEQIYAFDEHSVYFSEQKIEGVDMASFQVLNANFSKDKFHAYYMEIALKEVDAPSFKIMGSSVFQDKNNIYTFKQGEFVVDRKR